MFLIFFNNINYLFHFQIELCSKSEFYLFLNAKLCMIRNK